MSDADFKAALRDLRGTPPEVLEDAELLELLLPGLRADFALAESYEPRPGPRLAVAATLYYGEHDQIEEHRILAWQDRIEPPVEVRRIPGGHFFIHSHAELLTRWIRERLQASQSSLEPRFPERKCL
jgi:medium-chain acyl-[acyl-carrier-protein] hydrolase